MKSVSFLSSFLVKFRKPSQNRFPDGAVSLCRLVGHLLGRCPENLCLLIIDTLLEASPNKVMAT